MSARRFAVAALLLPLVACGATPTPPPPTTHVDPPPKAASPWLELTGTKESGTAVGHAGNGDVVFRVDLGSIRAATPLRDGGAIVVAGATTSAVPKVVRLDAQGAEKWSVALRESRRVQRVAVVRNRVYVFDLGYRNLESTLHQIDLEDGSDDDLLSIGTGFVDAAAYGDVLVLATEDSVLRVRADVADLPGAAAPKITADTAAWRVQLRSFPWITTPSEDGPLRAVAVGRDGVVVTGADDGSVVASSADGEPLFQIGTREPVARIVPRSDGDFVIVGASGQKTLVGPDGAVRKEGGARVPADPGGEGVVDRREDDAPAVASTADGKIDAWKHSAGYRVERIKVGGAAITDVASVLAMAPDDVWVLGSTERQQGWGRPNPHLFHRDAKGWSDLGAPTVKFKREVYAQGAPAEAGDFIAIRLERGPNGAIEILGQRGNSAAARPSILERTSTGLRERREPFDLFAAADTTLFGYACSPIGLEIVCVGPEGACSALRPGQSPIPLDLSRFRSLPEDEIGPSARYSSPMTTLTFAGEQPWFGLGVGTSDSDAWFAGAKHVLHWDGAAFTALAPPPLGPSPAADALRTTGAWASATDDVWVGTGAGVVRFDGTTWWRIAELETTLGGRGVGVGGNVPGGFGVTGTSRDDVWAFGLAGLFHVTPTPSSGAIVGSPPTPPAAAAPSVVVAPDAKSAYRLERVVLPVDGGAPLRSAIDVARSPGGDVVWFDDGARVVEFDGATARVIYTAPPPEPFECWSAPEPDCELCAQCVPRRPALPDALHTLAPSARGEGAILTEFGLARVTSGRAAGASELLPSLKAVGISKAGAAWVVNADVTDDAPHAFLDAAAGRRFVAGLPPAAYVAVDATADDDVWIAGGLLSVTSWFTPVQPGGEGTLVRFDGARFTRFRGPDGALLAVARAAPGDAWAVGLRGGIVHASGANAPETYRLDGEPTLRDVDASSATDVWIVGDERTILRWNGSTFERVDASAMSANAAWSAVVAPGAASGWVVGPSGVFKVVR